MKQPGQGAGQNGSENRYDRMQKKNGQLPVRVIRSSRKTMSLQVRDEELIVRVPVRTPDTQIRQFIDEHAGWIRDQIKKQEERRIREENVPRLTEQELQKLVQQARLTVPERVKYYAPLVGVTYGRITIRMQKTRWGSCSKAGNLNFNALLLLAPPKVLDSVVVHELCHRLEMNHSKRFYGHVLRVFPEYHTWHDWLKQNGRILHRQAGW